MFFFFELQEKDFLSYIWQILVKCKAGGRYNATGDENMNFDGTIDDITVFLSTVRSKCTNSVNLFLRYALTLMLTLASVTVNGRLYTWIKCNPNFESYYTTEYSKNVYEAFDAAFSIGHTVSGI